MPHEIKDALLTLMKDFDQLEKPSNLRKEIASVYLQVARNETKSLPGV
jgi:hypothetical protein